MELRKTTSPANPFLLFLPSVVIYLIIIFVFSKSTNYGDEIRYLNYASNLTHGFYSYPKPFLDLGDGPGYPLILAPLIALKVPIIILKLLNALFYYISVVFLFKALTRIVPFKFALIFSLVWAFYPSTFEEITYVLPEVFASSLIPLFIFFIVKTFESKKNEIRHTIGAGTTLGYLALTKPIFGYVLLTLIIITMLLMLVNRSKLDYKKNLIIFLFASIISIPWLMYTYHMTDKVFYWSSFGGNNIYWMSSPYEEEYGDWFSQKFKTDNELVPGSIEKIKAHHQKDFESIFQNKQARKLFIKNDSIYGSPYTGVIQDDILRDIAIKNIKSHPYKFLQNCISNIGRMLFNYPSSYTLQKPSTLKRLPVNGIIVVVSLFCLVMTLLNWKKISFSILFLLCFALIYFGGSIAGSAEPRMFTMIVPIILFWIAYILHNTVQIKANFSTD